MAADGKKSSPVSTTDENNDHKQTLEQLISGFGKGKIPKFHISDVLIRLYAFPRMWIINLPSRLLKLGVRLFLPFEHSSQISAAIMTLLYRYTGESL